MNDTPDTALLIKSLQHENRLLREALSFYANPPELDESGAMVHVPDFYDDMNFGERAQKALENRKMK